MIQWEAYRKHIYTTIYNLYISLARMTYSDMPRFFWLKTALNGEYVNNDYLVSSLPFITASLRWESSNSVAIYDSAYV